MPVKKVHIVGYIGFNFSFHLWLALIVNNAYINIEYLFIFLQDTCTCIRMI